MNIDTNTNANKAFPECVERLQAFLENDITVPPRAYTVDGNALPSYQERLRNVGAEPIFYRLGGTFWDGTALYCEQDPVELWNWLLDFLKMNGRFGRRETLEEVRELCETRYYERRQCASCATGTQDEEAGTWLLNLYVHQDSLQPTSVRDVIARNHVETYTKSCDSCGEDVFMHKTVLTHLPEVLTLSVVRYDNNGDKFPRPMGLTEEIDLARYVEDSTEVRSHIRTSGGTKYRLQAIIQHSGNADSGHYKTSALREDGYWYTMEDDEPIARVENGIRDLACQYSRSSSLPFYPSMLGYVRVPTTAESLTSRAEEFVDEGFVDGDSSGEGTLIADLSDEETLTEDSFDGEILGGE